MAVDRGEEFERRAAVLRRFRELLLQQRGKFERYLLVLDHEKKDIESGDVDRLVAHVELEEEIVSEIFTFQKVIDPLEDLYRAAYPTESAPLEVAELRSSLNDLHGEVLKRNEENRALLKQRMETLRSEIVNLRNPLAARKSVYSSEGGGSLLDIKG